MVIDTPQRAFSSPLYTPPAPPLTVDMSLEDVVRYYGQDERKRTEDTKPPEMASERVHIRAATPELASSVKLVAVRMAALHRGANLNVLTKCMARHLVCWYESLGVLPLAQDYQDTFIAAKRGHSVIRKQLEQHNFQFRHDPETINVLWEVPKFVLASLGSFSDPLGASVQELLVCGVAWSLTTLGNREWDEDSIKEYFTPEAHSMKKHVSFRSIDLEACRKKIAIAEKLSSEEEK